MLDFGIRKQDLHIAISYDEDSGDNTVTIELVDSEGFPQTYTGSIVLD